MLKTKKKCLGWYEMFLENQYRETQINRRKQALEWLDEADRCIAQGYTKLAKEYLTQAKTYLN